MAAVLGCTLLSDFKQRECRLTAISISEIALGKDRTPADCPGYVTTRGWLMFRRLCVKETESQPVVSTKLGFTGLQPAERGLLHGQGRCTSEASHIHPLMNTEF